MDTVPVLWADDDSMDWFDLLGERLPGVRLVVAASYREALKKMGEFNGNGNATMEAAIVDAVLPHQVGGVSLDTYLGIMLAEKLLERGITRICFLTVVREEDLASDMARLRQTKPGILLKHQHKPAILEKGACGELVAFLRGA